MNSIKLSIEPLLREFLYEDKLIYELEEALARPVSNQLKLLLIKEILNKSRKNVGPNQHYAYNEWLTLILDKILNQKEAKDENDAYFSLHDDIRDIAIKNLKSAKSELKICMFTISDDPIAEAIDECHSKGINVRIITDDGKIFDKGSDILPLNKKGISVRIDTDRSLMHHKFVIIDNIKLLTGSYNWTRTGADVNNENMLVTTNNRIVRAYKKEFNRLWLEMSPLRKPAPGSSRKNGDN
jgi:phosphatidylserine/phosphatidylglycerophosphate/cardiolipin synthase-like enzyme